VVIEAGNYFATARMDAVAYSFGIGIAKSKGSFGRLSLSRED